MADRENKHLIKIIVEIKVFHRCREPLLQQQLIAFLKLGFLCSFSSPHSLFTLLLCQTILIVNDLCLLSLYFRLSQLIQPNERYTKS